MINRELIRIKVVQLVYAYYQNTDSNLTTAEKKERMVKAEKELLFSLDKAYQLYAYMLQLICAVTQEEERRVNVLTMKAEREKLELPSRAFVDNKFVRQLADNTQLQEIIEDKHISWEDNVEFVRSLCNVIEQWDEYKVYVASEVHTYEESRELWRKIYKQFIVNNTDIDVILEEESLYWNDDREVVDSFVMKTIRQFDESMGSNQPLLPEFKDDEDKDYAVRLLRNTIENAKEYQDMMEENSRNWDFNRLAYMDVVIMQIAIAEMLSFPAIPVSVTINEYVELAKLYSTPRSGAYINGLLDSIAHGLVDKGILLKSVR